MPLRSATLSPKLLALQQILHECGIGVDGGGGGEGGDDDDDGAAPLAAHRALVFCQSREMLDLVEVELLRARMPSVASLRLDGGVAPAKRADVVAKFNGDPSIDVLLLTTAVGGLGLTLTAADVVVFVDHDWNPMRDLQAMDRAHRIGQTRVVNVYRLVARGTLEEEIMSLQAFKRDVAHAVVGADGVAAAAVQGGT